MIPSMSSTPNEQAPMGVRQGIQKLASVAREEVDGLHLRLLLITSVINLLPPFVGARVRVAALRRAGFAIGHGTVMWDTPTFVGKYGLQKNLTIGRLCRINTGCYFELGAEITIEELVGIGPKVMVLTTTHEIGPAGRRSGAVVRRPVQIGAGTWIGARSTILPGVTIGLGSIVAAGALVNRDVPANTLVAGVPARAVRELEP